MQYPALIKYSSHVLLSTERSTCSEEQTSVVYSVSVFYSNESGRGGGLLIPRRTIILFLNSTTKVQKRIVDLQYRAIFLATSETGG